MMTIERLPSELSMIPTEDFDHGHHLSELETEYCALDELATIEQLLATTEDIHERRILLHRQIGALAVLGASVQRRMSDCLSETTRMNAVIASDGFHRGALIDQLQQPSDMDPTLFKLEQITEDAEYSPPLAS